MSNYITMQFWLLSGKKVDSKEEEKEEEERSAITNLSDKLITWCIYIYVQVKYFESICKAAAEFFE